MNKVIKRSISALATCVLTCVVVASATTAASASAPSAVDATMGSFSTPEIVRGIVFTDGPVARALNAEVDLPEGTTAEEAHEYDHTKRVLLASMLQHDEHTLDKAAEALTSGNPYEVETAMVTLGETLNAALQREYPDLAPLVNVQPNCGAIAVCAAVSVAAIALGAAIAVVIFNVAGNVNMIYNQNGLWDTNGIGRSSGPSSDPTTLVEGFPSMSQSETVRHITIALARK